MNREDITGLVLAGGRGSRMGGVDKGLQPYRGRPLARWMLERLAPQVGAILISANRNVERYREFGVPVVSDESPDFGGPLAGMLSGLSRCRTPWLATSPCDAPGFPMDLVARLGRAVDDRDAEIAMASIETPSGPRIQPVFALLRASLEPSLREFVEQGGSKVREWMYSRRCVEVTFAEAEAFANLNTLEDLDRAGPDA